MIRDESGDGSSCDGVSSDGSDLKFSDFQIKKEDGKVCATPLSSTDDDENEEGREEIIINKI